MAPPKRELALTGAGASGWDAAKRLRVGVVTGASSSASCWPMPPASPGERLMRQTVLVVLFFLRMIDARTTVAESISQIGRMFHKFQKVQTLMMSKLENLEGKMEGVSLEVKRLARLLSNRYADQQPRQEPYRESATASGSNTNFHLRFLNGLNPKAPIYTEKKITAENNSAIRIGIFDGDVMIREGPLSKAKIEMLVLRGDFCNDGRESWTEEEFNSHIAQGRHGQGFILGGDCSVWLNNGEASFGGKIRFKEGSSRTRSRMFIVAARVCMDGKTTDRVGEAVMKPVTVLDRRNEANEKRHPPELDDEVYRLEEISKDGTYHRRLKDAQIITVQGFLKALNKDANKLREEVLRIKKLNNAWEKMAAHARECSLTDSHQLIAYRNKAANAVLFFNCVYDLVGAEFAGVYVARDNFDPANKALANELKETARKELDSTPFNYVMNGSLPVPVPSRVNSLVSMPTLAPDAALQETAGSGYHHNDRTNHVAEPSHHNEYVHGDQNTVNTHYFYQGEGIPPLSEQQPTTSATPPQWDGELLDWLLEGSGEVNILSQMQVPISMVGGNAMEASTSAQNNPLQQQFLPTQFQESMRGMHYPEDVPNPVAESLHDPEPSVFPFPGADYGSF